MNEFSDIYESLLAQSRVYRKPKYTVDDVSGQHREVSYGSRFMKELARRIHPESLHAKDPDGWDVYNAFRNGTLVSKVIDHATDMGHDVFEYHGAKLKEFIQRHGIRLDHPLVVYRGMHDMKMDNMARMKSQRYGMSAMGLSTTLSPNVAMDFATSWHLGNDKRNTPENNHILKIHVPAGVPFMPEVSKTRIKADYSYPANAEDELTFAADHSILVSGHKETKYFPSNVQKPLHKDNGYASLVRKQGLTIHKAVLLPNE